MSLYTQKRRPPPSSVPSTPKPGPTQRDSQPSANRSTKPFQVSPPSSVDFSFDTVDFDGFKFPSSPIREPAHTVRHVVPESTPSWPNKSNTHDNSRKSPSTTGRFQEPRESTALIPHPSATPGQSDNTRLHHLIKPWIVGTHWQTVLDTVCKACDEFRRVHTLTHTLTPLASGEEGCGELPTFRFVFELDLVCLLDDNLELATWFLDTHPPIVNRLVGQIVTDLLLEDHEPGLLDYFSPFLSAALDAGRVLAAVHLSSFPLPPQLPLLPGFLPLQVIAITGKVTAVFPPSSFLFAPKPIPESAFPNLSSLSTPSPYAYARSSTSSSSISNTSTSSSFPWDTIPSLGESLPASVANATIECTVQFAHLTPLTHIAGMCGGTYSHPYTQSSRRIILCLRDSLVGRVRLGDEVTATGGVTVLHPLQHLGYQIWRAPESSDQGLPRRYPYQGENATDQTAIKEGESLSSVWIEVNGLVPTVQEANEYDLLTDAFSLSLAERDNLIPSNDLPRLASDPFYLHKLWPNIMSSLPSHGGPLSVPSWLPVPEHHVQGLHADVWAHTLELVQALGPHIAPTSELIKLRLCLLLVLASAQSSLIVEETAAALNAVSGEDGQGERMREKNETKNIAEPEDPTARTQSTTSSSTRESEPLMDYNPRLSTLSLCILNDRDDPQRSRLVHHASQFHPRCVRVGTALVDSIVRHTGSNLDGQLSCLQEGLVLYQAGRPPSTNDSIFINKLVAPSHSSSTPIGPLHTNGSSFTDNALEGAQPCVPSEQSRAVISIFPYEAERPKRPDAASKQAIAERSLLEQHDLVCLIKESGAEGLDRLICEQYFQQMDRSTVWQNEREEAKQGSREVKSAKQDSHCEQRGGIKGSQRDEEACLIERLRRARALSVTLHESARQFIQRYFLAARRHGMRMAKGKLQSIVKVTLNHARLQLRSVAIIADAVVAIMLIEESGAAKDFTEGIPPDTSRGWHFRCLDDDLLNLDVRFRTHGDCPQYRLKVLYFELLHWMEDAESTPVFD